jgi:hypothetical protein
MINNCVTVLPPAAEYDPHASSMGKPDDWNDFDSTLLEGSKLLPELEASEESNDDRKLVVTVY